MNTAAPGARWWDDAACRDMDVDLFIPADGMRGKRLEQLYADAKAVCNTDPCPVREQCLADALARHDRWAVRGGRTPDERRLLARKKHAPRPCGNCGRPFTPQHAHALYCSTRCVDAAKRRSWAKDNDRRRRARQEAAA